MKNEYYLYLLECIYSKKTILLKVSNDREELEEIKKQQEKKAYLKHFHSGIASNMLEEIKKQGGSSWCSGELGPHEMIEYKTVYKYMIKNVQFVTTGYESEEFALTDEDKYKLAEQYIENEKSFYYFGTHYYFGEKPAYKKELMLFSTEDAFYIFNHIHNEGKTPNGFYIIFDKNALLSQRKDKWIFQKKIKGYGSSIFSLYRKNLVDFPPNIKERLIKDKKDLQDFIRRNK